MSLVLSVLYRVRTRWKLYLILALVGAALGIVVATVVKPAVTAEYQVSGKLPLGASFDEFGIDASQDSTPVVTARILSGLETIAGASDAGISSESDALLGTTSVTLSGRKSVVGDGVQSISQSVLAEVQTEAEGLYSTLVDRVSAEITSIDSTIQDLETNLSGTETDGRTVLLIQRSELVERRATLDALRSNATALRTSLSKSFPIRVTRTRFETTTLFGAPTWALALAIAMFLVVVVAAGGAIFGQRAHTAADVAGAFPNVKVVGAPPRLPTTSHLEVVDGTLHVDLSKVSLSEIALKLAENDNITSIAAHYPNESTFRTAIALGA